MISKTDFSKEEWFLLHRTPTMAGLAVLAADKSGFMGTTKETLSISKGLVAGATNYPANSLIQALLREKEGPEGDKVKDSYSDYKQKLKQQGSVEQITADILDNCRQAAALLEEKVPEEESSEYKAWVIDIANSVASAAKEKNSKRTNRGKVSAAEKVIINQISEALGVTTSPSEEKAS